MATPVQLVYSTELQDEIRLGPACELGVGDLGGGGEHHSLARPGLPDEDDDAAGSGDCLERFALRRAGDTVAPVTDRVLEQACLQKDRELKHVVPLLRPVWTLLREAWIEQGRPGGDELVCPPINKDTKRGLLSMDGVADRAAKAWGKQDPELAPIGLQECRHTAASWLDPAGVSPKTASILMGHSIPDRQPGAAAITLARYAHLMPDAPEIARKQMDEWIVAQIARETEAEKAAAGE